jgi:hypothetical protein
MKRYFVKFYTPGTIVSDTWSEDIDSPEVSKIKWPKNAYCFEVYEQAVTTVDGEELSGTAKQIGPTWYHPDSKIETLAEVKKMRPGERILISNMEGNGYKAVIWTRWGNWPQPYDPKTCAVFGRTTP